jgi:2-polyprenyl-3-methyl-5-hydroxy-6-metoxy-1,4-benzoquinol methylase
MNNTSTVHQSNVTDYGDSFNKYIFNFVPNGIRCLDVGCSTGNLGYALKMQKKCEVDGIEFDPSAAEIAKKRGYGVVHIKDLNREDELLFDFENKYDVIVCADVLEHLIFPDRVLFSLRRYLKPNGIFIVSLPNVAFILNRLQLLLGNWEYKRYGILDQTHLRFYTINSGCNMLKKASLIIEQVKPYNQFGALRFIKPLDWMAPRLFAYQFIVIAKNNSLQDDLMS